MQFVSIGLPNMDNGLEDIFSDIKTKLRVHSGLNAEHRKKLIDLFSSLFWTFDKKMPYSYARG